MKSEKRREQKQKSREKKKEILKSTGGLSKYAIKKYGPIK